MRKEFCTLVLFFLSLSTTLLVVSCTKEFSCEGCRELNKPPVANAGPDQVTALPTDSVSLDGTGSSDPDGTIAEWLWTKISGPASFNLNNPATTKTAVRNLDSGIYRFELMVKDDGGLTAKDTIQVTVVSIAPANRPPIANAGADQTITLPTNTITLNGNSSTDPDNNISSYLWTNIAGPTSFNIVNANSVQTQVSSLAQGVYQFELKVIDAGGLTAKDTIQVTVNLQLLPTISCTPMDRPVINIHLIPLGNIPDQDKSEVWADNKLFFAGGSSNSGVSSTSRVDIFNLATQTWTSKNLSLGRTNISAVTCANKVFFAGGMTPSGPSSRVDIYDIATQGWATAELSEARIRIVTATIGNKIFFAGGCSNTPFEWSGVSNKIDIYDLSTNTWSVKILSETKIGFTATTVGSKIYFAGGWVPVGTSSTTPIIDIYDDVTGTWSTSALNVAKAFHTDIFKNGKVYWGGGGTYIDEPWIGNNVFTCQVEIFDVNNQVTTFANLSAPFSWFELKGAFEKDDKIGFVNYDDPSSSYYVDLYNTTTSTWSIGVFNLSEAVTRIISANNNVYVIAGGQVWKMEF